MLYPTFESLERRALMSSSISGTVFNDANSNSLRDAGEAGLAGKRVFIDENSDGRFQDTELNQFTDANGEYSFGGLDAGTYRVRLKSATGFRQTAPQGGAFTIVTGGDEVHAANDFGLTTTGVIRGTVFNDTNEDGIQQNDEAGIAGIVVYLDKNGNGKWDPGKEKARTTNLDGDYRIQGLKPGKYAIRIVRPDGVALTTPAVRKVTLGSGQSLSNRDFGLI